MIIAIEGNAGTGKTTLIKNIQNNYKKLFVSKSNETDLIRPMMQELRRQDKLTSPVLYELIQLADFSIRYNEFINSSDEIIVCDRYYYTIMVRSLYRGSDINHLNILLKNYVEPDIVFYLKLDPDTCLERISKRAKPTNDMWTMGINCDLNKNDFNKELFIQQLRDYDNYYKMIFKKKKNIHCLDASKRQIDLTNMVMEIIDSYKKRNCHRNRY